MRYTLAVCVGVAVAVCWQDASARQQAPRVDFTRKQMSAVQYLKASNAGEDDKLGIGDPLIGNTMAISADGNTLVVGAPHEDSAATGINGNQRDDSAWDSGAAYVFVRAGNNWSQQAYIKASNTQSSDKFASSVALSGDGNTLAVGAVLEDGGLGGINVNQGDNSAEGAGAAYVFVRSGSTWTQQAYVKASNPGAGDQYGWSIALSHDGNTLAVGAQTEGSKATGINGDQADNSAADSGAAYVYSRSGTTWTQQAYVKAPNAQGGDQFGFSIALSGDGNTLLAGSYNEDGGSKGVNGVMDEGAGNSGAAYVFVRRNGAWAHESYLKASNTVRNISFGSQVEISRDGSTIAVTAVDETNLRPGIDGDGASTPDNAISAGAVYVFGRMGDTWQQQAYVKTFNPGPTDLFGVRLSLSGDGSILAAGAPGQGGGGRGLTAKPGDNTAPESGAVYVFTRTGAKWSQHAYLKAPNSDEYDHFGSAVAMSRDGSVLAVAADGEDGSSNKVGGNQNDNSLRDAGAVFVF